MSPSGVRHRADIRRETGSTVNPRMLFVALLQAGLTLQLASGSAAGQSIAQEAAKKLGRELETRKSVELKVHVDIRVGENAPPIPFPVGDKIFDSWNAHFIEDGARRFRDLRFTLEGKESPHQTHYSDGERFAEVSYDPKALETQSQVAIKRVFQNETAGDRMERPDPVFFLYVGKTPLPQALAKASHLGADTVLQRKCDVFLFKGVRWYRPQDHVYYLDHETAIPLKVAAFENEAERTAGRPLWIWTAQSLDKVQGHPIVLNSTMAAHAGKREPHSRWITRTTSASFGKKHPDSTFWPKFDPGVSIHDQTIAVPPELLVLPPPPRAD